MADYNNEIATKKKSNAENALNSHPKNDILMTLEGLKQEALRALSILITNLMADVNNRPTTEQPKFRRSTVRIPFFEKKSKDHNGNLNQQPPSSPELDKNNDSSMNPLQHRGRRMSLTFGFGLNRLSQTSVLPMNPTSAGGGITTPSADILSNSTSQTKEGEGKQQVKTDAEIQMSVDVLASESLMRVSPQLRQLEIGRAAADMIEQMSQQNLKKGSRFGQGSTTSGKFKSQINRHAPFSSTTGLPPGPSLRRRASTSLVLTVPPQEKETPESLSVPASAVRSQLPSSSGSNMAEFQRSISSSNGDQLSPDHLLALMLAGLCNAICQFLETEPALVSRVDAETHVSPLSLSMSSGSCAQQRIGNLDVDPSRHVSAPSLSDSTDLNTISTHLQNVMSNSSQLDYSKFSTKQTELWADIQSFLELLRTLVAARLARGEGLLSSTGVNIHDLNIDGDRYDLEHVMQAMDRITLRAPRLFAQDVVLTEEQARALATVRLGDLIQRMSRKNENYEAQRASPDTKYRTLNILVEQIVQSAQRRLDGQRVELTNEQIKRIDWSQMEKVLDRSERLRFGEQDWISKEDLFLAEVLALQEKIESTTSKTGRMDQIYVLSEEKERDLDLMKLASKLEKLTDGRAQQVAATKEQIKDEKFAELLDILEKLPPALENQEVEVDTLAGSASRSVVGVINDVPSPELCQTHRIL